MTPLTFAILCFAAGFFLVFAEVLLPSHGVLGVLGTIALLVGVGAFFRINQYAGLAAAVGLVALMPFAAAAWVKVWPHTYAGKRLILGPTAASAAHAPAAQVAVGQVGVVVSELRPGGVCEFAGTGAGRVEARAEQGVIPAGRRVEVIAIIDHRPVVRAV